MDTPPPLLVDGLLTGPSIVTGFEWHAETDSTMRRAAELAAGETAEGYTVLADVQTSGRGRRGRSWVAPPGSSLLCSVLLRPALPPSRLPLLPLVAGLALAEAVTPHVQAVEVALKWPNDLLAGGRKAGGVLTEAIAPGAVVLGVGLNVDWRGVERPAGLEGTTSLAEAAGGPVDRWRVFAGFVGVLGNRYRAWLAAPLAFLDAYRARSATLGRPVLVTLPGREQPLRGVAEELTDQGALLVRDAAGVRHAVLAGDVEHVRPGTRP
jgi:BirA family biotin operon repressor/biotin-[acetyl-CoA-carboxylase] ligase